MAGRERMRRLSGRDSRAPPVMRVRIGRSLARRHRL
jgi:hypothetical protein